MPPSTTVRVFRGVADFVGYFVKQGRMYFSGFRHPAFAVTGAAVQVTLVGKFQVNFFGHHNKMKKAARLPALKTTQSAGSAFMGYYAVTPSF
jgi:hypothetical protein